MRNRNINHLHVSLAMMFGMGLVSLTAQEYVTTPEEAEQVAEQSEAQVEKAEDHAKKPSNQAPGNSYFEKLKRRYMSHRPYLMVPPLVIPIIKQGNLMGYLNIMVEIKGTGVEAYRTLREDLIRVREEIFNDLYLAMSRLWRGDEPPAAEVLEKRIQKRVNQYYKRNMVEKASLHLLQLERMDTPPDGSPGRLAQIAPKH